MPTHSEEERPSSNIEPGSNGSSSSPVGEMGTPSDISPPSPVPPGHQVCKGEEDTTQSNDVVVCRGKNWRYVSFFQGPWLKLPIQVLEIIATINYDHPRPRPLDPAVVFDVLKIRKAVDQADGIAGGAAIDLGPSTLVNVDGGASHFSLARHHKKLSGERKLRMREQACQKLAHAYRLDEIACSVATRRTSTALKEVAGLVLQRKRDDLHAKYVYFFHEKIAPGQLVDTTSLSSLNDIIESAHDQAEVLRTRALAKVLLDDLDGAMQDLTRALDLQGHRLRPRGLGRIRGTVVPEEDQPSGLSAQLLFHRASVQILMACRYVDPSIGPSPPQEPPGGDEDANATPGDVVETQEVSSEQLENRRRVKKLARRALNDYTCFLSCFDYSPNVPKAADSEFNARVAQAVNSDRKPYRPFETGSASGEHTYPVSRLFAAVSPQDLPPHPFLEIGERVGIKTTAQIGQEPTTSEKVTYHPLLAEALHALLLCHCLLQTSVKELQRHAQMVARLMRISDGFPVFRATTSPAQYDWVEVLRRTTSSLPLGPHWEILCTPAFVGADAAHRALASAVTSLIRRDGAGTCSPDDERRGLSGASSQTSISEPLGDLVLVAPPTPTFKCDLCLPRDPSRGDACEHHPLLTERAAAIARWVLEVPIVTGMTRRRKRSKRTGVEADGLSAEMSGLDTVGE
ncbi:uncharacterized protein MAM_01896 [Metarhizium album ARSEF 1941]|uniref:Uncharacterized protein n=1 Tax=Metarhizium album (strain ARSEF 1941) TaxID=1081103 RepID=A0A0B2X2K4_METAS|nr:uncharacterized protein MAM_01896 [Metarhizium album ARSEF 1941]KHN99972.1 hypothetical protein MAM_01896 [Metarhizium album ARSEF 1941]